jgi:integrase
LVEGRTRDLAMFNLAIDSKLRGCDVVALKVEDVAPNGYAVDRATVRQKKTGRPIKFELTDQTREAIDDYVRVTNRKVGEFLFTGRSGVGRCMTTRQYARLVSGCNGSLMRPCFVFSGCHRDLSMSASGLKGLPFNLSRHVAEGPTADFAATLHKTLALLKRALQ